MRSHFPTKSDRPIEKSDRPIEKSDRPIEKSDRGSSLGGDR